MESLLLTFDYEVYLGPSSGTASNCCIQPADKIISILKKHQCKGIFFVDALYLVRLKEVANQHEKAKEDFSNLSAQIRRMVLDGHYVFNHLHPHWLDAQYDSGRNAWNLSDKKRFAFSNLDDAGQILSFDESMKVLYGIIREVKPDYVINGFRAGGLFIQPFSVFKKHFLKHGIKYDFSVMAGAKCEGEKGLYSFDFTTTPGKRFYRYEDEVTNEKADGSFIEFPLAMCRIKGLRKILNGIHYRLTSRSGYYKRYGDGLPSGNQVKFETPSYTPGFFSHIESFSVESISTWKMSYYLNELKTQGHLHIISHPKLVSDYNLEVFDKFLGLAKQRFNLTTDIKTILAQS